MRWLGVHLLLGAVLLLGSSVATAHEAHQTKGMDDQLLSAGEGLMVGGFDAPQQGPLVVVPYADGPLECGVMEENSYLIPVGNGTAVSFVANATHVQATLDVPPNATGFVSFALDTKSAHRTMMLMLEHAIAMHGLGGAVLEERNGTVEPTFRSGVMGVPYLFPDAANASQTSKYFLEIDSPGGGIRMEFEDASAPASWCTGDEPGHYGIRFARFSMWDSLKPGSIVHGLVHWDHELAEWLPRPIPTTDEFQVNLYLTRASEDAGSIQKALDPAPRPQNLLSVAGLFVGLVLVARPRS